MAEEKVKNSIEMGEPRPVELEIPIPDEKPKRGRPKKKEVKKEEHADLEQNLTVMVRTVFDLLALRDPVWKLADQEVEAVAKPGARILARLGAEQKANKNADYFLLAVGVAGILLPRVMIIRAKGGQVKNEQPERKAGESGPKPVKPSPPGNRDNVKQLLPGLA